MRISFRWKNYENVLDGKNYEKYLLILKIKKSLVIPTFEYTLPGLGHHIFFFFLNFFFLFSIYFIYLFFVKKLLTGTKWVSTTVPLLLGKHEVVLNKDYKLNSFCTKLMQWLNLTYDMLPTYLLGIRLNHSSSYSRILN